MIRHTPAGRGHAYRPSLDQRVPTIVRDGEPVEIRALVPDGVTEAWLEVDVDGEVTRVPAARPLPEAATSAAAGADDDGGHLAAAAAAGEHAPGMTPVAVTVGPFDHTTEIAYRWLAADDATDWFRFRPARWTTGAGVVDVAAPAAVAGRLDGGVDWLVDGTGAVRARFARRLEPGEHVIGLGERFHALDHRGHAIDTVVFEQYKQQGERTYLPVPFGLVVGGPEAWGFHVDTTRRCWFDVGASRPDRIVVEVAIDPSAPRVDLHLSNGEPREVIAAFLDRTGRPGHVPSWVFRPWASANEWNTQARVEAEMARSRDEGVAVGVLVIEAWADEATFTAWRDAEYTPRPDGGPMMLEDFTFPADGAWPDPAGMIERLHEQGIKVLLWQIPVLPTDVPDDRLGAEQLDHDRSVLVERGFAVREEDGTPYTNRGWWFPGALLPDFTSREATDWWLAKRRYLVEELGVDGFKTDGGEHAWGDELRFADGSRGDTTNNLYPNLYTQAYHRLLDEVGREGVTFSRAGFTGAGTTPCHWAGDEDSTWEAYRAAIVAGQSAGVSGVFAWGWDHGGFSGEIPTAELYLRTGAQAMLCPIMQYHAEYNHHRLPSNDRTPWNIAERHDDPSVLATYRRFTQIRERLVDHLAEQYRRGVEVGLPLMRALALTWPHDPEVWAHPLQYMLGDHLLVAPVTDPGVDEWTVHLPAGTWTDVWSGEVHEGGRTITVPAPLDQIPAFATADAPDDLLDAFRI